VFLHVIIYNQAAIHLYSRAGFTLAGRLPNFYYIHSGRQPDPGTCVYDALLYVQHTAPDYAVTGWDVVALAVSPLRAAWGRLYGCMPQWSR
jgi:ribosomal protein S18 acetylase RimI-like enzyme